MCHVTVRLPGTLMQIVGGERTVAVRGRTLREVLDDLVRARPELGVHVFDERGVLRHNLLCAHGDALTGRRGSLDVPVAPNEEVTIVQAMSGG